MVVSILVRPLSLASLPYLREKQETTRQIRTDLTQFSLAVTARNLPQNMLRLPKNLLHRTHLATSPRLMLPKTTKFLKDMESRDSQLSSSTRKIKLINKIHLNVSIKIRQNLTFIFQIRNQARLHWWKNRRYHRSVDQQEDWTSFRGSR